MKRLVTAWVALSLLLPAACNKDKELDPAQVEARRKSNLEEAAARLRNNKVQDAERFYSMVLEEHPEDPEAMAGLGIVRYHQKQYEEAESLLTKAVAKEAGIAQHHAVLAEMYAINDRTKEAVAAYAKAFELEPDNSTYGLALGRELVEAEEYAKAEEILRQVADLDPRAIDPNGVGVHTALGDALRGQDKLDDALRTYMKAQTTYGSDKMAFAGAAFVYEAQEEIKHALDQWSAYIQRDCCSDYSRTVAQKKIMELEAPPATAEAEVEGEEGEEAAG